MSRALQGAILFFVLGRNIVKLYFERKKKVVGSHFKTKLVMFFIALFVPLAIIATVVEYWMKPLLVGRRTQMHILLVFLSLIGGAAAFGAVGLLLGPLMMAVFLTLLGIYRERYRPAIGQAQAAAGGGAGDAG